ncbi:hypothetical protein [Actinopolymorpha pittospori]
MGAGAMGLVGGVVINIVSEIMTGASRSAVLLGAPLLLVMIVALWDRWRRYRQRRTQDLGLVAPDTPIRPTWFRESPKLHGRDGAVQLGANHLKLHGAAAVVGPPGTGSSAVAAAVVDTLIEDGISAAKVAPFDLRGWAWEPDSALTLASHLLPAFGLTAPVTEDELPHAGERLGHTLVDQRVLLVLDNLAEPSQIDWLVRGLARPLAGASTPQPTLLVVGRPTLVEAFGHRDHVHLGPLPDHDLRSIWSKRLDDAATAGWSAPWSFDESFLAAVIHYCAGLPKAVHDLAREFTRTGALLTPDDLVDRLARTSVTDTAMAAVWTAILERTTDSLSRRGTLLLEELAELPVTELTVEAIEAVRGSLDELIRIRERDVESADAGSTDPPPADPIAELLDRRLIRQTASGRYRLPQEIRSVVQAPGPSAQSRASALMGMQALVRHYSGLARTWMFALDTPEEAAAAARWFHTTEPLLQALLSGAADANATVWDAASDVKTYVAEDADAVAGDATFDERRRLLGDARDHLVDDLCLLTDALDRWRSRASRPMPMGEPPVAFLDTDRQAKRPELEQLAAIRAATALREAGRPAEADDALARAPATPLRFWRRWPPWRHWRRNCANALRARRHHETALNYVALAGSTDDPTAAGDLLRRAEDELQLAWNALPAKDLHGHVTTLLTMAEVFLRQGVPDSALERLDIAESRAAEGPDPCGLAQVAELRGVAAWMQGRSSAAVVLWQRALTAFNRLADRQGQARCLQHLGSAVLVAPELTGLVLDERRRPHDEAAAVQHALAWLERSQRLRTGPVSELAQKYLDRARTRARRVAAVTPADVPPSPTESEAEELPAESGPSWTERPRGLVARLLAVFGRGTP